MFLGLAGESNRRSYLLSATVSAADADGDTLSYTYAWYVDGSLVRSGASSTLSGLSYFSRDQDVTVTVTASDGVSTDAATSAAVTVSNTPPTAPTIEVTPADPVAGDALTCSVVTASADADGDAITYTFDWDVDGVAYSSATDSLTDSVVNGADVGAGETWSCDVVADDGDANAPTSSVSAYVESTGDCTSFRFTTAGTYFDGSATTAHALTNSTGNTIEFWIYIDTGAVGQVVGSRTGSLPSWSIRFTDSLIAIEHGSSNYDYGVTTAAITPSVWHHVAFVRSAAFSTVWRAYIDGADGTSRVRSGSVDRSNITFPSGLHVGGQPGYSSLTAEGAIASLHLSNTARYTSNFTPSAVLTPDSSTVLFYDFAEGTGTTTYEGSGRSYDLTITSGTWQTSGPECP